MCSTKCAIPPRSALSWREPRVSQTPMLIERTCVMRSVRKRRPLSRTSRTIGEFKMKPAAGTTAPEADNAVKHYATIENCKALGNETDTVGTAERTDLADLERAALEVALDARGHPRFHARQIFR